MKQETLPPSTLRLFVSQVMQLINRKAEKHKETKSKKSQWKFIPRTKDSR